MTNRTELYNDKIGFVEHYDFSTANTSQEARVKAVTDVASICYNKEAKDKIKRFNLLESESLGLPSTSFEFVPVLVNSRDFSFLLDEIEMMKGVKLPLILDIVKYGEWIHTENGSYLLTNLRACLNTQKKYSFEYTDFKTYFNTSPKEIQIIKDNFKVFKQKIPLFIARQLHRHRVSFQELSRRYTSDKTAPIEFYEKFENFAISEHNIQCLNLYNKLVDSKTMKPEDARAVLPVSTYTTIWSAFLPSQLDNFIKLRTKETAQDEIIELANGMKELIK